MSHAKFGPKVMGLCLLATLSLMAITAAGPRRSRDISNVDLALLTTTVEIEALKSIQGVFLSTFGAGGTGNRNRMCRSITP